MSTTSVQIDLFNAIKNTMPAHLSMPDEVAALLNISIDSAYRRIREEKQISLDELQLLCTRYQVSVDQLFNIQSQGFVFAGKNVDNTNFSFVEYMQGVLNNLIYLNSLEHPKLYYEAKDIPIFHHFHSKELAAFKYFFWMKSILQFPEYKNKNFSIDDYADENYEIGKKIFIEYAKSDSVEIWNTESINSTINQIEFYKDTRCFNSLQDVLVVYEKLDDMVDKLERMAIAGKKFDIDNQSKTSNGNFEMYFNEVMLGHNHIMFESDKASIVFLNHSGMNYIGTRDISFCSYTLRHLKNMMSKSLLISSVSERERNIFFKSMHAKIYSRIAALK